ncbi:hypothetical protein ACS127_09610 [Amphibacillus sp. Q70]|uniref:hypothetical protein n=1 Tax=Amphibacillus sp. Q70 TaxID=3453416 RepID=UPI003F86F4C2
MKYIYAFETKQEYSEYEDVISQLIPEINQYKAILEEKYELKELPNGFVWTTPYIASHIFSNIKLPAYTRNEAIYLSPDKTKWLDIFHEQQGDYAMEWVDEYYKNNMFSQLREIACHELTHHIDLFPGTFDDYADSDIWFEEGMAFYIPRKNLLSTAEMEEITKIERTIAKQLNEKYGNHSVFDFGEETYEGSIDSIMFDYFRSYLIIKFIVEQFFSGDELDLLKKYNDYFPNRKSINFESYFNISLAEIWQQILKE